MMSRKLWRPKGILANPENVANQSVVTSANIFTMIHLRRNYQRLTNIEINFGHVDQHSFTMTLSSGTFLACYTWFNHPISPPHIIQPHQPSLTNLKTIRIHYCCSWLSLLLSFVDKFLPTFWQTNLDLENASFANGLPMLFCFQVSLSKCYHH